MFVNSESVTDGKSVIQSLGELRQFSEVDPEDYSVAMTISPNPGGLPRTFGAQYKGCIPLLTKILSTFGNYYLTVESTLNGNIHFHVGIAIKHKGEYVKGLRKIKTNFGNTLVKFMDNPQVWYDYCTKDVKQMEDTYKLSFAIKGTYKEVSKGK